MYRNVCFTDFDTSDDRIEFYKTCNEKYVIFQVEKAPDTGRLHIQGYMELKKRMRLTGLKKKFGDKVHFERRKGSAQQAADYCKKDESRVTGPFEVGTISQPGKRNDLLAAKRKIDEGCSELELAEEHFTTWCRNYKALARYQSMKRAKFEDIPKDVTVYWGDAGTGKSRAVVEKEGYNIYSKPDGQWFDGYEGQEAVVFDDFTGDLNLGQFLKVLDRYPMKVPVKGGFVNWIPKRIYITSNLSPEEWYPKASSAQHAAIRRRIGNIKHYVTGLQTDNAAVDGFISSRLDS